VEQLFQLVFFHLFVHCCVLNFASEFQTFLLLLLTILSLCLTPIDATMFKIMRVMRQQDSSKANFELFEGYVHLEPEHSGGASFHMLGINFRDTKVVGFW
jgi:hypothetical protein